METDNNFKYHFLYSPRTNYNNKLETEQKLFLDLVKSFDPYSIKILKKHFKEHLGNLNKEIFICILKNHLLSWRLDLSHRETIIIKLLSKLFDEIDINSNGEIQWNDFVNYIINISNINLNEKSLYSLQCYTQSKTTINHIDNNEKNSKFKYMSSDSNIITYCFYISKYKLLGIVHEGKSKIIFYNTEKRKIEMLEIDLMETQKEINEYEINELNIKAEKMIKKEEEEKERKIKLMEKLNNKIKYSNKEKERERLPTPDSVRREIKIINNTSNNDVQKNLKEIKYYPIYACFVDDYDILFISTSNNKISAWRFDYKRNEFKNINNLEINNINSNFEDNIKYIPLYSCELPQYAMCFDNNLKALYSGQEDGKIFQWGFSSSKPVYIFEINDDSKNNIYNTINASNTKRKILNILSLSKAERNLLINEKKEKKEKNKESEENEKKKEKEKEKEKTKIINYMRNKDHKNKSVSCLLLISNLRLLCSSYYTGQIILWDTITKKPKKIYNDQKTIVYQVIYNPIKNRIYTCGFEHEIYVYDPYNEEIAVEKIKGHMSSISSISFNREINEMISIDIQGIMKIWDTNNFTNFQTINIKESLNSEVNNDKQKKKKNIKLNSNFYVEALSNVKQIIVYEDNNLILFEKGKTLNPNLCDDNLIIGCAFNSYSNELITISTERIKCWNIFNGKVNKIFENLMNGAEISNFELDKRNKKCYLGDINGKIRCYNLINGILLKEFKSHNFGIIKIIHSLKYKMLITGSSDLCIRIHSGLDDNDDNYKEININNYLSNIIKEKKFLKNYIFNEDDNMLIIALSNGWVTYYDLNYNKFINDNSEKNDQGVIKRTPGISSFIDLPNIKCLFVAYENGERYIISKINNKYYNFLSGKKFGEFIEDDDNQSINDNKKRKNIIYSSVYDDASNRLIIGDHTGFIFCYELNKLNEIFAKNYNSKEEILLQIKNSLIIPYLFKIQPYKQAIINLSIPINLFPKIFIAIGSDSVVKLFDFERGDYIESLKQISIKYTSVPVAISFINENPFGESVSCEKEEDDDYFMDVETKKRKEKILQTIQNINKNHKNYLVANGQIKQNTEDNDEKETIIYRCEIEPNLKMPQLNYQNAKRADIIKYSSDILEYNAKIKLASQIMGQNILPDKSSPWNYDVDFEYIIRKEKEEFRKLYIKIRDREKDVKDAETNFQHLSIINKNYKPLYLNNFKSKEKIAFSDFIKEKLRIINLSSNKRKMIITEEKEIKKYIEKHKYPHNFSPLQKSKSNNKDNILKYNIKIKTDKRRNDPFDGKNIINKNVIPPDLKSYNTIGNNNLKKRRILCNKSLNIMIPTNNNFNDLRFLECKNKFDEKFNEISTPLKLIIKKYPNKMKLPKISQNIFGNKQ